MAQEFSLFNIITKLELMLTLNIPMSEFSQASKCKDFILKGRAQTFQNGLLQLGFVLREWEQAWR